MLTRDKNCSRDFDSPNQNAHLHASFIEIGGRNTFFRQIVGQRLVFSAKAAKFDGWRSKGRLDEHYLRLNPFLQYH